MTVLRNFIFCFFISVLGLVSLCLTDGFADADAFAGKRFEFPPPGDYIQGSPEFQRVPENIFGTRDFEKLRDLPKDSQDYDLSRKVGMIATPWRDNPNRYWICTGFLVGPDLFLTNSHCIHDGDGLLPLAGFDIYMDYYEAPDVDPTGGGVTAGVSAVLRAEYFKDYALLRLDKPIGNTYGWLELDTTTVNSSQSVKLISHPQGRSKEIVRKNSQIVDVPPVVTGEYPFLLAYRADAEGGSSGSPVFLRDGTGVIGIHHSAWSNPDTGVPVFNAGTLMSHIVPEIQQWLPGGTPPTPPPKPSTKLMYWTDPLAHKILRANLNGTDVQTLVRTPFPNGLALDTTGGKIYWVEGRTHRIRRANLDGTNPEDLITAGLPNASGPALDVAGGKMYWLDTTASIDKIRRANLNGTNIEDLVDISYPFDLALDVAGGKIYWTDLGTNPGEGKIQRANLDGTNIEDLVSAGLADIYGLALDATAGKMYWTDSFIGGIRRANLDGTNIEDLITESGSPVSLALDVAAGKMYWADFEASTGRSQIWRANLDGTNIQTSAELLVATGTAPIWDIALYLPGQQAPRPPRRPPNRPPTLSLNAVRDQTLIVDTPVSLTLPTATGGSPPYTYTLSPIPTGLAFDGAKRALSGTPTTLGTTTATYTATDASGGTASLTFRITVTPPPITFTPSTIADQVFRADTPITALTLPLAMGGTPPYTYSLSPIPTGLAFESAKRALSGTPTTPGTTTVTYTATDASEGTASLRFRITVTPAPLTFTPSAVADQTFIVNTPITPLVLPSATGGRPPYTYRISPTPIGFRFESGKRALSGTPTIVGTVTVTYIATDVSRETVSLKFKVTVITPIALKPSRVADQVFTVDTSITPLTLPPATGGAPPYTYTLSPIPEGLDFDAGKRELSGTPTTLGTTTATYTATDTSEQTAVLTFTITVIAEAVPDLPADVNADGEVSIIDLVIVALSYGTQGATGINPRADVTGDGVVNLLDLMAVAEAIDAAGGNLNELSLIEVEAALVAAAEQAAALEAVAAAPKVLSSGDLASHTVAAALADAKRLAVDNGLFGFLELLSEMATIPEASALLPNYPNPFNPETWIPYHLAKAAEVTLTIYDMRGVMVRELKLGHKAAGVYISRGRAIYWDGRNMFGEKVASGVYFYTLSTVSTRDSGTAGDFTATRKLFILK